MKAVKEMIDELVNFELMSLQGDDPNSKIIFKSITHQRFFNIILVDFLSVTDKKCPIQQTSYLAGLRAISSNPNFDVDDSIAPLRQATNKFKDWLEQIVEVSTWLPSIEKEVTIKISRFSYLKMVGNISKHNYLRAIGVAEELKNTLENSGISVEINSALLILADFYERFHTDILNYHSSAIAEFLNNIRWGIFEYLQPEFHRSIVEEGGNPSLYQYSCPEDINSELAKTCYWGLMDEVRSKPYMRKFKVTKCLKMRY